MVGKISLVINYLYSSNSIYLYYSSEPFDILISLACGLWDRWWWKLTLDVRSSDGGGNAWLRTNSHFDPFREVNIRYSTASQWSRNIYSIYMAMCEMTCSREFSCSIKECPFSLNATLSVSKSPKIFHENQLTDNHILHYTNISLGKCFIFWQTDETFYIPGKTHTVWASP